MSKPSEILVTGCAGFIGAQVCERLLSLGHAVVGVDNLGAPDAALSRARMERLAALPRFSFHPLELASPSATRALLARRFTRAVHLAAQTGVRASMESPGLSVQANVAAFVNVLEACREARVEHLVFASSSSVYGAGHGRPSRVGDDASAPLSLYAATKRSGELAAHSYAHLYALPVTGLRFFTVYGPWNRADMAVSRFTRALLAGQPLVLLNPERAARDFVFVEDVVEAVVRVLASPPPGTPPFRLLNVGRGESVRLTELVSALERQLGRRALVTTAPPHLADAEATCADVTELVEAVGFRPSTSLEEGLARFAAWYRAHHGV